MTYSAIQSNVVTFPSFSVFGRPQTRNSFIFFFYFPPVLGLSVDLFSFLEYCFRFRDHFSLQPNSSAYNTEVLTLRIQFCSTVCMRTCAFFWSKVQPDSYIRLRALLSKTLITSRSNPLRKFAKRCVLGSDSAGFYGWMPTVLA